MVRGYFKTTQIARSAKWLTKELLREVKGLPKDITLIEKIYTELH